MTSQLTSTNSNRTARESVAPPPTATRVVFVWAVVFFFMAAMWVLSSMPHPPISTQAFPLQDKGAHFLAYMLLGLMVHYAASVTWVHRPRRFVFLVSWGICIAWGALDELHQAFVPGRSADMLDVLADTLGSLVSSMLAFLM
jgi:VanZ family protein